MDEEEEYEEYETVRVPARRLRRLDAVILGLEFLRAIASAVEDTLGSAVALTAAHANYDVDREEFMNDAAIEIETITGEQE